MIKKHITVIGSGFAGLTTAACLAKKGFQVDLFEKNESTGGRARKFEVDGFTFDMGPSWYWMPEVFNNFYSLFGKKSSDFYNLVRLNPSYRIFFPENQIWDIPAGTQELGDFLEKIEKGAKENLTKFLKEAEYKYKVGMNEFVFKPCLSFTEFLDLRLLKSAFKLDLFKSIRSHINTYFKNPLIRQLLEFPILFLGATPQKTPALYSLMNFADISMGTWYPMGGMFKIVDAFTQIAKDQGVNIHLNSPIQKINIKNKLVESVSVNGNDFKTDLVVGSADYQHIDKQLLPKDFQNYSDKYWDSRKMAPSCILFYLGVSKKIEGLIHHNLFFDEDFEKHSHEIYTEPNWPKNPLFYACVPSKTDDSVAPLGYENLFLLIPVAPGMCENEQIIDFYFDNLIERIEKRTGVKFKENIIYKKSYAYSNFVEDYNAFKGNAYGLANTLKQTAILKPSIKNKNINNLYYTGQLTVPGPGVPPSIISGQVVANLISKQYNN